MNSDNNDEEEEDTIQITNDNVYNEDQKDGDLLFWATHYYEEKMYQKSKLLFIKLFHLQYSTLGCTTPSIMHNIGVCFYYLKDAKSALKWFGGTIEHLFLKYKQQTSHRNIDVSQLISTLKAMAYAYRDLEDFVQMDLFIHIAKSLTISCRDKKHSKLSLHRLALFNSFISYLCLRIPFDYK